MFMTNAVPMPRAFFLGREFHFSRADGSVVCDSLTLVDGGRIQGHRHPDEAAWEHTEKGIVFLDMQGKATTVFDRLEYQDSGWVLHGNYVKGQPGNYWHILTEKHPRERHAALAEAADQLLRALRGAVASKIVSVFLVHNITTWDCLHGVYRCMSESEDFLPFVITIPLNFGKGMFHGEDQTHAALDELGIPHVRFNFSNHWDGLRIIKSLRPDILFRQSPWDVDIPSAYSVKQLSFTKLVYTDSTV